MYVDFDMDEVAEYVVDYLKKAYALNKRTVVLNLSKEQLKKFIKRKTIRQCSLDAFYKGLRDRDCEVLSDYGNGYRENNKQIVVMYPKKDIVYYDTFSDIKQTQEPIMKQIEDIAKEITDRVKNISKNRKKRIILKISKKDIRDVIKRHYVHRKHLVEFLKNIEKNQMIVLSDYGPNYDDRNTEAVVTYPALSEALPVITFESIRLL